MKTRTVVFVLIILTVFLLWVGSKVNADLDRPPDPTPVILIEKSDSNKVTEVFGQLDRAMDVVSMGGHPPGSFTDWFVPRIEQVRQAGANSVEINLRLNRVQLLAEEGKYFSPYLEEVNKKGPHELRLYIAGLKWEGVTKGEDLQK